MYIHVLAAFCGPEQLARRAELRRAWGELVAARRRHDELTRDADASDIDFLPFSDLEQSVREDVELIRSSPLIAKDTPVTGFVYDVKTGKIHEVA